MNVFILLLAACLAAGPASAAGRPLRLPSVKTTPTALAAPVTLAPAVPLAAAAPPAAAAIAVDLPVAASGRAPAPRAVAPARTPEARPTRREGAKAVLMSASQDPRSGRVFDGDPQASRRTEALKAAETPATADNRVPVYRSPFLAYREFQGSGPSAPNVETPGEPEALQPAAPAIPTRTQWAAAVDALAAFQAPASEVERGLMLVVEEATARHDLKLLARLALLSYHRQSLHVAARMAAGAAAGFIGSAAQSALRRIDDFQVPVGSERERMAQELKDLAADYRLAD